MPKPAGITRLSHVCGGDPCIAGTRIPVWLLIRQRQLQVNEFDILRGYPELRMQDLEDAWRYYQDHTDEIEGQIREHEHA